LVLWGDEDTMSDDTEQRRMLEALPDVRDAKVPRAGHLSAIENPGEVTKRLVSFAAEVRRTGNDG
jgi:pimeloyl-ACP methyl ester carboxylesterase